MRVSTPEKSYRTDRNCNPAAFTTDVARDGHLVEGTDYVQGEPFTDPATHKEYFTAKLLGDFVAVTIKCLDVAGYYTSHGTPRWTYIAIPKSAWDALDYEAKKAVILFHYSREGGTDLLERLKPAPNPTGYRQIPTAGFIEAAATTLRGRDKNETGKELSELREAGFPQEMNDGYLLGLETARTLLLTSPRAVRAGVMV